jgi:hypothetical protein
MGWMADPTPWPVGQVLSWFGPRLHGHVSTWEEEAQGSGSRSTQLVSHVARPTCHHMVRYRLGQLGGAPPWPYKYPLRWKLEHTHMQSSHS